MPPRYYTCYPAARNHLAAPPGSTTVLRETTLNTPSLTEPPGCPRPAARRARPAAALPLPARGPLPTPLLPPLGGGGQADPAGGPGAPAPLPLVTAAAEAQPQGASPFPSAPPRGTTAPSGHRDAEELQHPKCHAASRCPPGNGGSAGGRGAPLLVVPARPRPLPASPPPAPRRRYQPAAPPLRPGAPRACLSARGGAGRRRPRGRGGPGGGAAEGGRRARRRAGERGRSPGRREGASAAGGAAGDEAGGRAVGARAVGGRGSGASPPPAPRRARPSPTASWPRRPVAQLPRTCAEAVAGGCAGRRRWGAPPPVGPPPGLRRGRCRWGGTAGRESPSPGRGGGEKRRLTSAVVPQPALLWDPPVSEASRLGKVCRTPPPPGPLARRPLLELGKTRRFERRPASVAARRREPRPLRGGPVRLTGPGGRGVTAAGSLRPPVADWKGTAGLFRCSSVSAPLNHREK